MAKQIVFETDNTICSLASYARFPPAANIYSRVLTLSKSAWLYETCKCPSYNHLDNVALRKKKQRPQTLSCVHGQCLVTRRYADRKHSQKLVVNYSAFP